MVQLLYPYMTTGKTIALTIWTFVSKVMSLLFNTLSRFAIAFLLKSKCLLHSRLLSLSSVILETPKMKSVTASTFSPFYLPRSDGPRCHDLSFFNVDFQVTFFTLLILIKRFFSVPSLSAIGVVSAYLRLLIFLPVIF